ncbi:hypothetical protein [Acinetobacter baumannii]|uniref:hypothetical protein n=1 Tax=Acinetobacter baumannii TaxID=470 RepID=UPI000671AC08|nr:hypothetical protein [Acinetobacter baumannii]ELD1822427.1 hypothetical protein [Acinetobacter baumannii]MBO0659908.1 hypothetical protein [Acinetobacter baumannii]RJN64608.1 hypothetical protein D3X67_20400 [Acinetobacter baumannii]RKL58098.1 hypothetical protein CKN54_11900 [Acinetobacter baumannii]CRX64079.1 putative membrane protein [Acinetobacter baumannii]
MAKDDLKVKIKRIWVWTIIGIVVYLIISFFLKSSYPITHHKFNLSEAYEVLKDTLTLAAGFLAPVAAFVLFSDWREQHVLINNEKISKEILNILDEFYDFYNLSFGSVLENDEFYKKQYLFFQKINYLAEKKAEINAKDQFAKDFLVRLKEIQILLPTYWILFTEEVRAYQDFQKFHESQTVLAKGLSESYSNKHLNAQSKKFDVQKEIFEKRNKLSILYV